MDFEKNWKEKWGMKDSLKYLVKENNKRCRGVRKWINYIDAPMTYILFGATFHDFMIFQFYKKNVKERRQFLTTRKVQRQVKLSDQTMKKKVDDKACFNELYFDLIKREWLNLERSSFEEFCGFLKRHNSFFLKAKRESCGLGVSKHKANDIIDLKAFYEENRNKIIEEPLIQHSDLAIFNPNAVNIIRVVSTNNNGEINILAATLRSVGIAGVEYNVGEGDIFVQVDIKTGVCFTDGFTTDRERFVNHPLTGVAFKGFQIPNWDIVITTVIKAAKRAAGLRIIGWDVAITEKGCALIEGNPGSGTKSMQISDGIGKYDRFKKLLK